MPPLCWGQIPVDRGHEYKKMKNPMKPKKFTLLLVVFLLVSASLTASYQIKPIYAQGITLVQGPAQGSFQAQGITDSFTVTLNSTPTIGNLLIATVGVSDVRDGNTVYSLSQSGVTWTQQVYNSQNGVDAEIWAGTIGSGASSSITITLTSLGTDATVSYAVADICEYSGLATFGFLDQVAINNGNVGLQTDTGTTLTTSQPSELWIGAIATNNYAQETSTNGFVLFDGQDNNGNGGLAYLQNIVSVMGQANSGTSLPAYAVWSGCIATFATSAVTATAAPTPIPTPIQTAAPTIAPPPVTPTTAPTATPTATATPKATPTLMPLETLKTPTPTHTPTLSPKATAPTTGFGLVDWVIVAVVIIIVLVLALFAFYSRRGKPTATMHRSQAAPPISEASVPAEGQVTLQSTAESAEQNNYVNEMPMESSVSEDNINEDLVSGDLVNEEVEENVLQIEIDPHALSYLKRRGEVFILTDLKNRQYAYNKIKAFDASVAIDFREFVEVCKTSVEDSPTEFTTATFNVASPMDSKQKDLAFYVGKSGFSTVNDWLKASIDESAIPECSTGRIMFCLYYIRARRVNK